MSTRIASLEISMKRNGILSTLRLFYLYLFYKYFSKSTIRFRGETFKLRPRTSDFSVFREIFMEHEYALGMDRKNKTIIDLGANIGISSVYFSLFYPGSRIIAVEADKENFEILSENVKNKSAITPLHYAIWKENAPVYIETDSSHWARKVSGNVSGGVHIPGITLDSLMEEQKIGKIDLLKVDIEGSEIQLFGYLAKRPDLLKKISNIVVETHDAMVPGCSKAVFDSLAGIPYNVFISGEKFFIKLQNQ